MISPLNPATAFHVAIAADFHRSIWRSLKKRYPEDAPRKKNTAQKSTAQKKHRAKKHRAKKHRAKKHRA
ncbi:MAG: hypothetical protein IIC13_17470, partial [SAR324 cluster bacterium]|nr:hypothetical protein [SAR324 cluster bacterium]